MKNLSVPKPLKIVCFVLAVVAVWGTLGYFGLRAFVRAIYKQRTCEWANIDNVELHAEVNVPAIHDCECVYKKEQNTKFTRFDIDKGEVNLDEYIQKNHLRKLASSADIQFEKLLMTSATKDSMKTSSAVYHTKGTYKQEKWQALLDSPTGRLWVTIEYEN